MVQQSQNYAKVAKTMTIYHNPKPTSIQFPSKKNNTFLDTSPLHWHVSILGSQNLASKFFDTFFAFEKALNMQRMAPIHPKRVVETGWNRYYCKYVFGKFYGRTSNRNYIDHLLKTTCILIEQI